jgi:hypothetical protein
MVMAMVKIAWLYKKHGDGDDCGYDGDDYGVGNMMVVMMVNGSGCGYVACD